MLIRYQRAEKLASPTVPHSPIRIRPRRKSYRTGRRGPHEGETFVDGRCDRCGRPRLEGAEYLDEIESLAATVVSEAHEYFGDLRGTADGGPELQRAIVHLANQLRHYHFDGDGCLDGDVDV